MIELVVVMGLFAAVAFAVALFSSDLTNLGSFVEKTLKNQEDLGIAFGRMVVEIRSMGPSSLGAYPIAAAATSSLSFYSDVDKDGIYEQIRYFASTSTLERGVITPAGNPLVYATSSEIISTMVRNALVTSTPLFEYFDESFTGIELPLSSPINITSIRVIKVSLSADVNPGVSPVPAFYTNTINMRNLRSN